MTNNDVLRSIRYILSVNNEQIVNILALADYSAADALAISAYVKKEEEEGYQPCPDELMASFLNGLVLFKRGKDDKYPAPILELPITNNIILKKLRVAFELKDIDIHQIYTSVEFRISKPELSALFRKEGNKNYRPCGDQMLRYFLKGLGLWVKG